MQTRVPAAIWMLGGVSLLMDVSSEMIHALLPVFMVGTLGASAFAVGLIQGLADATALVVKVFSGAGSDRMRRRKPLALAGYALGALSKPLFALAPHIGFVLAARVIDRIGKGVRGAPRDALIADLTPAAVRGAAYGLRQALDTTGAVLGPALAIALMVAWHDDFRAVFWVAVVPGLAAVALLALGVREAPARDAAPAGSPLRRENLQRLPAAYWWVVAVGAALMLARFSQAFLVLRASQGGLADAWTPLVPMLLSAVYALAAYPFGSGSDRVGPARLLAFGVVALVASDLMLAAGASGPWLWGGIALWGLHMGATQGIVASLVAQAAPADLRGTAYGLHELVCGVALLLANALAGLVWDCFGAAATFGAGAGFALLSLGMLVLWRRSGSMPPQ